MTSLIRYDAACRALAEAKAIDEVKEIVDKASALKLYARQAKNRELEIDAAEIRMRAERRLGEMLQDSPKNVGARGIGVSAIPKWNDTPPKLSDLGIDPKLSMRAQKVAAIPVEKFEGLIGEWRERVNSENERVTATLMAEGTKAEQRAARETELAAKIEALPDRRYGVILADPEWRFEPRSRETGMDRAPENHYPTSTLDEIKARDVPSIAAADCVLFLWATAPMLPHALEVMTAWGFSYRSHLIWAKDREGTGYWFRNRHELLLVGARGAVPAPAPGTQSPSVVEAPRGEHSAKPETFLELIEGMFPTVPKIELNRRGPARSGWDAWGNEAKSEAA